MAGGTGKGGKGAPSAKQLAARARFARAVKGAARGTARAASPRGAARATATAGRRLRSGQKLTWLEGLEVVTTVAGTIFAVAHGTKNYGYYRSKGTGRVDAFTRATTGLELERILVKEQRLPRLKDVDLAALESFGAPALVAVKGAEAEEWVVKKVVARKGAVRRLGQKKVMGRNLIYHAPRARS